MDVDVARAASKVAAEEAGRTAIKLIKEGGRGAILLGAARLDLALENLLKAVLLPNVGGEDNLFDPDRPLGTFSAKIALTYRMGLIDKSTEHALQMIRKVRNDFAHSFEDSSLSEQSHRNRLTRPFGEARKSEMWPELHEILRAHGAGVPADLRDFICLVVILVSFIEACAHASQRTKLGLQVQLVAGLG